MKSEEYSFLIIPHKDGETKELKLPGRTILLILSSIVFFALVGVFLSYHYFSLEVKQHKISKLSSKNEKLKKKFKEVNSSLDSLSRKFKKIKKVEKIARIKAGLPEVSEGIRQFGYGGPNVKAPKEPHESNFIIDNLDYSLDDLALKLDNEKKALQKVCSTLTKKAEVREHTPTISPMRGYLSSTFGKRLDPFTQSYKMHTGVDICNRVGTPVKSAADGKVIFTGWENGYGKVVKIDHTYYKTFYAHLHKIKVDEWEKVKRGDIIATNGKSGRTTGPHLHYEVRVNDHPVNPINYIYSEEIAVQ